MTTCPSLRLTALSVLLATTLLSACNDEGQETLLASARSYLAGNDSRAAVIQIKNALQKNPDLPEARFLLGKAFLESGNPVASELELRKAIELKYSPEEVKPLLAKALLAQGRADKVIEGFSEADLNKAENRADLLTTIGMAHALQGNLKAAQASVDKALALDSGYGPAIVAQARIKAGNRNYAEALTLVDSVVARDPKNQEAWKLKGDIHGAEEKPDLALAAYRRALEIRPDFIPSHAAVITSLIQQSKLEEAGQQLEAMKKVAAKNPQTLYLELLLAFRKGNLKEAHELAQQLLRIFPDNPSALQLAGAVEYQLKSWTQAEAYLSKAVHLAPDLPLARRLLVATYMQEGQAAKALTTLQPVLEKMDGDAQMLALAGQVYVQNGEVQKAEHYFSKAAALDPGDAGKRTSLAITHLMKGQVDTAFGELEKIAAADTGTVADLALITSSLERRNFDRALQAIAVLEKKQPSNPLVYDLRGRTLYAMGNAAEARKSFERALSVKPGYFPAVASLANLDLVDRKPEQAKKRFEQLLTAEPGNFQAMLGLADVRRQMGAAPDEIAAQLSKAISAGPTASAPRLALVEHYLRNKDAAKAVAVAQEAVSALPDRPELLSALGRAQQIAGNANQALATYGKLANLQPSSPDAYMRMAEVHLAAKNQDEALRSLRKALEIKPALTEALTAIIKLHLDAGRSSEALAVAREVQQQGPASLGFTLEGDIGAATRKWADAVAAYRSSLRLASNPEVAVRLHAALVQQEAGNMGEADKFSAAWLKDHPKDALFRSYLGDRAIARKDLETAARYYRAALEIQPENPAVLNNLAWVAGQQKDARAIQYAEKAIRLAPNQPALMDTLAMLLAEKGDTKRALELLQRAAELAPGMPQIKLNLARVLIQAGNKTAARKELEELNKLGDKFPRQAEIAQLMREV